MYFFIQATHLLLQFLVFCGLRSTCGSGLLSFQNKGDYLAAKKKIRQDWFGQLGKKKALANVKVLFSIKPEQLGNVFLSLSSVEKFTQLSTELLCVFYTGNDLHLKRQPQVPNIF